MSKLSHGLKSGAGFAFNPNAWEGAQIDSLTGPGVTGQRGGGQVQFSPQANERANQIMKSIQAQQGAGTYGEGQIATANSEMSKLLQEMQSGNLSQADYLGISDAIVPQIKQYINAIASSGSRGANAAQAAGSENFLDLAKHYDVYKSGKELLGRDLTPQEAAQFLPSFSGGSETGRAALAQYAQQQQNSPQALQKRAGQYSGDVNRLFTQDLGRSANSDEADYYGRLIASGLSPYEVENYVKQLPEYQNNQDKSFRSGLNDELAGYDQKAFGKAKEDILSRYSQAGLQNSSALDFAMTNLMGDITSKRGQYLAGISAQQYGGNKDAARGDYQSQLDNYLNNQNYQTKRSDSMLDNLQNRSWEVSDYNTQRNDYMNMMNNQPRQKTSPFDYLNAGLNTVNTGANVYKSMYPYG